MTAPAPAAAPRIAGFAPALAEGTSWTFAWTENESSFVQGSGASQTSRSGTFTVTLGAPRAIEGVRAFPVAVAGEARADGRDLAPRWRHLAVDGARLLGSEDGATLRVLFDAATGEWAGGGFFAAYADDARVAAQAATAKNEYLDTSGYAVTRSTQSGGCVYDRTLGNICGGDAETSFRDRESWKPGVGPLAYEMRSTRTDSGGGFYTSFSTEIHVGLVATTLEAADGWTPRMPPWTRLAPLATPRDHPLGVALDGRLYVIGGLARAGDTWLELRDVEVYDPRSGAWTAGARAPAPLASPAGAAIDGRIHVVEASGGAETALYVYDPAAAAWSEGPTLLRGLTSAHAAAFGDELYVVGTAPGASRNVAYLFDASEQKWYETDAPPTYRNGYAFASDGRYALFASHYYDGRYDGAMHRFDYTPGTWDLGASMAEARFGAAAAVVDGEVFVMGGRIGSRDLRSVEAYDVAKDAWRGIASMPSARSGAAAVALDGAVYVVGGLADGKPTGAVDRLDARAT